MQTDQELQEKYCIPPVMGVFFNTDSLAIFAVKTIYGNNRQKDQPSIELKKKDSGISKSILAVA